MVKIGFKSFHNQLEISYTTSPLSEYIGSHIYEIIGIPVHKTILGIKDKKIVVACKDFRKNPNIYFFDDFNSIKNDYVEGLDEKLESTSSSSSHGVSVEETMIIMDNNPLFFKMPALKRRFWDMFIIDALIGNNDRNNGNWGVLVNSENSETELALVFNNGASFNTKSSDDKIEAILNDNARFVESAYGTRTCIFEENAQQINPFKYIESLKNKECIEALIRIVPKINLDKISEMINEITESFEGIDIISKKRKEFYIKCFKVSLWEIFISSLFKGHKMGK